MIDLSEEQKSTIYEVSGVSISDEGYKPFYWKGTDKPYKQVSKNNVICGYILKDSEVFATISKQGIIEGV